MSRPVRLLSADLGSAQVSGTVYSAPATGNLKGVSFGSTAADRQITYRTAGTMSHLCLYKVSGTPTGATARVSINGSDGNGVVSLTSTNGEYEDVSGSDDISAGNTVVWKLNSPSGTYAIRWIGALWSVGDTDVVNHLAAVNIGSTAATGSTSYWSPAHNSGNGNQANQQWQVKVPTGLGAVTLRNLYVRLSANNMATVGATISVNGATGAGTAPSVSIPTGGGAAIYEDTSHSIVANDGDLISLKVQRNGTGSGSITIQVLAIEVLSSAGVFHLIAGAPNSSTASAEVVAAGYAGSGSGSADASARASILIAGAVASQLSGNCVSPDTGASLALAVGGSATAIVVDGETSGWKADTTHSVTLAATDRLSLLCSDANGAMVFYGNAVAITVVSPAPVTAPVWVSPADTANISDSTPFVFTSLAAAKDGHFELQFDRVSTFDSGSLKRIRSFLDSGWEYWDGEAWQPLTASGMPAGKTGNNVRYTPSPALTSGTWYRRVRQSN